jgi:hypothetical protein
MRVDVFPLFIDAINFAPCGITDADIVDLSSLALQLGFIGLLCQIEAHNSKFYVAWSGTSHREAVPPLIPELYNAIPPGPTEIVMSNLIPSLRELAADRSHEGH